MMKKMDQVTREIIDSVHRLILSIKKIVPGGMDLKPGLKERVYKDGITGFEANDSHSNQTKLEQVESCTNWFLIGSDSFGKLVESEDTRSELEDTRSELEDARSELEDARSELEDARSELEETQSELEDYAFEKMKNWMNLNSLNRSE